MKKGDRLAFDELFGGTLFYRMTTHDGELVKMKAKFKIGIGGVCANAVRLNDGDIMLIPGQEVVEISRLPWR